MSMPADPAARQWLCRDRAGREFVLRFRNAVDRQELEMTHPHLVEAQPMTSSPASSRNGEERQPDDRDE